MSTLFDNEIALEAIDTPALSFTPRDYQLEAIDAIERDLWTGQNPVRSTLLYLFTGAGKSEVLVEWVRRHLVRLKRVMIVVPTKDLVQQMAQKVRQRLGFEPGIEQGTNWAREVDQHRVIVASRDSLHADRIQRFKGFGAVILDEAHHYAWENKTTQTIVGHFLGQNPACVIVGCTATPNREDDSALGRVFDACAYKMGIAEAVPLGWAVGPEIHICTIAGLDFSELRTVRGDLEQGRLAEMIEQDGPLLEIADVGVKEGADKLKTLWYVPSVNAAEHLAHILAERYKIPTSWVCGDYTRVPKKDRSDRLRAFKSGELRGLVNVDVLSEGFDAPGLVDEDTGETLDPGVEHLVMGSPTKSLTRYTQRMGRGVRPIPGTVDFEGSTPESRLAAIAASAKPVFYVTDIADCSSKHRLITATDVLGGSFYPDEVRDRAYENQKKRKRGMNYREALDLAMRQVNREKEKQAQQAEARKERHDLRAKALYERIKVNPFDYAGVSYSDSHRPEPITDGQLKFLKSRGFDGATKLTKEEAREIMNRVHRGERMDKLNQAFKDYLDGKGPGLRKQAAPMRPDASYVDMVNDAFAGRPTSARPADNGVRGGVDLDFINDLLRG